VKKLRWLFCTVVATLGVTPWCHAQNAESLYPSKPVRVVIPFPAGGGPDVVGRYVGIKLTDEFRQQFVTDNRSGAAGIIGTEIAAKAPADGYTLLLASSAHAYMPSLYTKLPFDVVNDFTGVIKMPKGVLIGVGAHYLIMPLVAFAIIYVIQIIIFDTAYQYLMGSGMSLKLRG